MITGGLGDLVATSCSARSCTTPPFLWIKPYAGTVAGAQHLDGFAAWFSLPELLNWAPYSKVKSSEPALFGKPVLIEQNYKAAARGSQYVRYFASLIRDSGCEVLAEIKQPKWRIMPWEHEAANTWLARLGEDAPLVYFGNLASVRQRSLDPALFKRFHDGLVAAGLRIVVDHAGVAYTNQARCHDPIFAVTDLTWGVRAAILSRASACLTVDTGVLHVAAALGVPTVGIYGPTTHEHIASHYRASYKAPVTHVEKCSGCFWETPRGHTDECATAGCKQLAAVDVDGTIRLVESLCGRAEQVGTNSVTVCTENLKAVSRDRLYGRTPCDTCS